MLHSVIWSANSAKSCKPSRRHSSSLKALSVKGIVVPSEPLRIVTTMGRVSSRLLLRFARLEDRAAGGTSHNVNVQCLLMAALRACVQVGLNLWIECGPAFLASLLPRQAIRPPLSAFWAGTLLG